MGESGLNYLCAGYRAFFAHIDQPMRQMAAFLRQGRAPAEAMPKQRPADCADKGGPQRSMPLWQWIEV